MHRTGGPGNKSKKHFLKVAFQASLGGLKTEFFSCDYPTREPWAHCSVLVNAFICPRPLPSQMKATFNSQVSLSVCGPQQAQSLPFQRLPVHA